MWLLIGAFSLAKKIAVFTDDPDLFRAGLFQSPQSNIDIKPTFDSTFFDIQSLLSPWSSFQNTEQISQFEVGQLN